jgi:hypothetical protein
MTAPKLPDGHWNKPHRVQRTELLEGQAEFLEWLTDPEVALRKESLTKYAAEAGKDKSTLCRWKKDPVFVKAWEARLAELNVNPERMQTLMDVLYRQGSEGGNVKAIELYFKLNDRMTPEKHILQTGKAAADMSNEELAEMLAQRAAALRA